MLQKPEQKRSKLCPQALLRGCWAQVSLERHTPSGAWSRLNDTLETAQRFPEWTSQSPEKGMGFLSQCIFVCMLSSRFSLLALVGVTNSISLGLLLCNAPFWAARCPVPGPRLLPKSAFQRSYSTIVSKAEPTSAS